ncbi:MAG: hypothetical protein KKG75_02495 [Nanoarchaeota archaeon]|nr:hypothetical protein [Nanoarchaeota archaeon]
MEGKKHTGKRKPSFIRQDTNKAKKLKIAWRRPKGLHSKLRLSKKGHQKRPSQGYRAPRESRKEKAIMVYNLKDLENTKEVIVSSTVGKRKKIGILNKAKELGIKVLNIKDIDAYIKNIEEEFKKKKEEKKSKKVKKEEKKKELEKKSKEKKQEKKSKEEEKKDIAKKLSKDVKQKSTDGVEKIQKPKQIVHQATAPKQR